MVQNAKLNGGWVLIQNCHLSIEFCNEILDSMTNSTDIHEKFRIWITTESSPRFPISNSILIFTISMIKKIYFKKACYKYLLNIQLNHPKVLELVLKEHSKVYLLKLLIYLIYPNGNVKLLIYFFTVKN